MIPPLRRGVLVWCNWLWAYALVERKGSLEWEVLFEARPQGRGCGYRTVVVVPVGVCVVYNSVSVSSGGALQVRVFVSIQILLSRRVRVHSVDANLPFWGELPVHDVGWLLMYHRLYINSGFRIESAAVSLWYSFSRFNAFMCRYWEFLGSALKIGRHTSTRHTSSCMRKVGERPSAVHSVVHTVRHKPNVAAALGFPGFFSEHLSEHLWFYFPTPISVVPQGKLSRQFLPPFLEKNAKMQYYSHASQIIEGSDYTKATYLKK